MKTALVTGAAGFVGRHLVKELLHRGGYQVIGVDVRDVEVRLNPLLGPYLHVTDDCRNFLAKDTAGKWDLAFHCAAVIGGRVGIEQHPLSVAEDIEIDAAFFKWLRRTNVEHAVYYSSSAAYPIHLQDSVDSPDLCESDIELPEDCRMPDLTYGWAKLTGEYVAQFVQREKPDQALHVLRPFSGYGEDQDTDYPFPAIVQRAAAAADPLTVWHDTVRDFIHIDDVIGATFAVIEQDVRVPLNLCTGRATSFTRLAHLAAEAARVCLHTIDDFIYHPRVQVTGGDLPRGVRRRVGNPFLMSRVYAPRVTLEEGVRRAVWHALTEEKRSSGPTK